LIEFKVLTLLDAADRELEFARLFGSQLLAKDLGKLLSEITVVWIVETMAIS